MSLLQELAEFIKRLVSLEDKVDKNANEIRALRSDLKALADFTQRVAAAVKRNQENLEEKQENLVLSLKVELLELEKQLNRSKFVEIEPQTAEIPEQLSYIQKLCSKGTISKEVSEELSKQFLATYVYRVVDKDIQKALQSPELLQMVDELSKAPRTKQSTSISKKDRLGKLMRKRQSNSYGTRKDQS